MINKRNTIIILAAALIAGLIYYRENLTGYLASVKEGTLGREESAAILGRELNSSVTYKVPNGEDTVNFSVFVDGGGFVANVKSKNVAPPSAEIQLKLNSFSENLLTVIKGKKLSEIENIDKIGTSSLTTAAFNSALADLKSQL